MAKKNPIIFPPYIRIPLSSQDYKVTLYIPSIELAFICAWCKDETSFSHMCVSNCFICLLVE